MESAESSWHGRTDTTLKKGSTATMRKKVRRLFVATIMSVIVIASTQWHLEAAADINDVTTTYQTVDDGKTSEQTGQTVENSTVAADGDFEIQEIQGLTLLKKQGMEIIFTWTETQEQIDSGYSYNVYVDGELYATYYAANPVSYIFGESGAHTIKVTAVLKGEETAGIEIKVEINELTMQATTTTTKQVETTKKTTTTTKKTVTTTKKNAATTKKQTATTKKKASTTKKNATTTKKKKKVINPTRILKAEKKKKATTAKISLEKAKNVKGYQTKISTMSSFKGKAVQIKKYKTTKLTVKGLLPNTNYYVKVRTYRVIDGVTCYSKWSGVKKIAMK